MKERELGNMQIAGERIRIVETATPDSLQMIAGIVDKRITPLIPLEGTGVVVEWKAIVGDLGPSVASAVVFNLNNDPNEVGLVVHVTESHRRLGLGRFMIRLGTDQAIRYRKRAILAEVENTNETALKILDEEDFEKQPEEHPGYTLMKKELKWV